MKYKFACGLLSVCMLFALSSCGGQVDSTGSIDADEIERINTEETYPSISATLAVTYHDVESITNDADIIVKGTGHRTRGSSIGWLSSNSHNDGCYFRFKG